MNNLRPINDTDGALTTTTIDEEMLDWHIANMPPNTVRAYKNAVAKIDAWLNGIANQRCQSRSVHQRDDRSG